jgi:putative ABC transport system substrate-binding protein
MERVQTNLANADLIIALRNFKIIIFVCALLFALGIPVEAQEPAKIFKIGHISGGTATVSESGPVTLRRELSVLGYVEGKNIIFESRYYEGKLDRLPALAEELVRLKVDVIYTATGPATKAAKNATTTIPIVFLTSGDPVVAGSVASLARPGGNITGFTTIAPVLAGKRLEILKETVPKLARVAVLWTPKQSDQSWNETQVTAREQGLQVHSMGISTTDQFDNAFKAAAKAGSVALAVMPSPLNNTNRKKIAELAAKNRLPAIYPDSRWADAGGLMSYGADLSEPYKRVASMIDKILMGIKPAEIPVEQPKKFEFVVNLKSAKQISLTIPPNVLVRADRVIR